MFATQGPAVKKTKIATTASNANWPQDNAFAASTTPIVTPDNAVPQDNVRLALEMPDIPNKHPNLPNPPTTSQIQARLVGQMQIVGPKKFANYPPVGVS